MGIPLDKKSKKVIDRLNMMRRKIISLFLMEWLNLFLK
jgi:hypothetical protein